jgi:hypothetical protein
LNAPTAVTAAKLLLPAAQPGSIVWLVGAAAAVRSTTNWRFKCGKPGDIPTFKQFITSK